MKLRPTAVLWPVVGVLLVSAACHNARDPNLIIASGHVEATDVRIATKVPGTLAWFPLEEGDTVATDEKIAQIDTIDVDLALAAAKVERAQAGAELSLRLAGARPEEIAEAQAGVAQGEADLAGAQRELDRMQGLLDTGAGVEKSRDDAKTRRDLAAAGLDAARERLRRLQAGSRAQEIDAARARLAAADARIAQIEQQLKDAELRAPLAAVVTAKLVEPGELLAAGTPLVVLTDIGDPWLTAYVGEPDLGRLRLGQTARVVTDDGQERDGTISYIASEAEFTPKNVQTREERVKLVFKIKVALPNDDGLFKPGMPAEARISAAGAVREAQR